MLGPLPPFLHSLRLLGFLTSLPIYPPTLYVTVIVSSRCSSCMPGVVYLYHRFHVVSSSSRAPLALSTNSHRYRHAPISRGHRCRPPFTSGSVAALSMKSWAEECGESEVCEVASLPRPILALTSARRACSFDRHGSPSHPSFLPSTAICSSPALHPLASAHSLPSFAPSSVRIVSRSQQTQSRSHHLHLFLLPLELPLELPLAQPSATLLLSFAS